MTANRIIVAGAPIQRLSRLREMLESDGHRVAEVASPSQTIEEATRGLHDVLILDSDIRSVGEGACEYDVCRTIRPRSDLGIILLIRDDGGDSRVNALDSGADDYLTEPFTPAELLARVRALLRRVAQLGSRRPKLVLEDRVVNLQSHEVLGPANRTAHLTPKEFNVLRYLLAHPNASVSHRKLASAVWNRSGDDDFEFLRVVISQLRRKLEPQPENPRYIVTDRSQGYRFQVPRDAMPGRNSDFPPALQTGIPAMVQ